MHDRTTTRRRFLARSAVAAGGLAIPYVFTAEAEERAKPKAKNDRFGIGSIGMRYQGSVITQKAIAHGDVVAVSDVDRNVGEQAMHSFAATALYEDYRKLLDRKDVDVVMIGTPDHWHTKMVVDACRAGKDVYCEKPLTLTIDEGKILCRVVQETGRIVQVGTWQRSDWRFRLACEMVRQGRLGKLQKVHLTCHSNPSGGPFQVEKPPAHFNWDLWQGQTPAVPYIKERSHYTFRWWFEYSGGTMTDWGAHIVDIAHWAMGCDRSGPVEIDGQADRLPDDPHSYNVPPKFSATMRYADGVEVLFGHEGRGGVLFEGDQGRIFVNRGTIAGKPVDELKGRPLPREQYVLYPYDNPARPLRAGKLDAIINQMGNFFDCVKSRKPPISDVVSQHRSASACHLGNIAIRLGRKLTWDPEKELFVGDEEANCWLRRERRKPYQIMP
jgi:myo-inositol 2-dehydrogenase / D-chiro-inositol 1-dehydrogenase